MSSIDWDAGYVNAFANPCMILAEKETISSICPVLHISRLRKSRQPRSDVTEPTRSARFRPSFGIQYPTNGVNIIVLMG